ncbi:MAG: hypothetical protein ACFFC6_14445 [Promethearchaeota archaeon]
MTGIKAYSFIHVMLIYLLCSLLSIHCVAVPQASVTFEIDRVYILEDRDYGAGEIYLKVTVGTNQPLLSSIYTDINDGDTIQLDWIVFNGESDVLNVRIDVWESDADYDEASNDFLGQITFSWDCQNAFAEWYDCVGPSGGSNLVQAQVYVVTEVKESLVTTNTTSQALLTTSVSTEISPQTSGKGLLIVLGVVIIVILGMGVIFSLWYYRSSQQEKTPPTPSVNRFTIYQPQNVTSSSLSAANQPFFCQLCGEKHPAGSPRYQCDACARMICVDAFENMMTVGRTSCPMCGGSLRRL